MKQEEALSLLKMGENIFLTGAAGAGKTYLLNQYILHLKEHDVEVAITASTGIAATHLQGTTLHAWSGIGIKDFLTPHDLEKLMDNKRVKRNYKKTKVLIIDEISMLHPHQLDMVDTIARYMLDHDKPFGGIQVVLCGDFFQLPPVSRNADEPTKFAFESNVWNTHGFKICYLHEQHRQSDDLLLTVLNDIRSGTAGEHTRVPLRTRYKKEPQGTTKPTKLFSRNINVDGMNDAELTTLPAQKKIFTMSTMGFGALVEGLKKSCLAPEKLVLKIGAEIMFVKNDVQLRYVNGTRGVVTGFENSPEGWPIVRTNDNRIVIANAEEWKYQENGAVRAILTQVPLRLAWAITIHKSQGMTLDTAEIDLGDAFEPGMGYVALSRVRSLSGLKLMNLNAMALTVHPDVLQKDTVFKQQSEEHVHYLHHLSDTEKTEHHRKTLHERFEGCVEKITTPRAPRPKKDKTPTHIITLRLLEQNLSIDAIVKQRGLVLSTVLTHLEKLQGLKLLKPAYREALKARIPQEDFDVIFAALKQSEDGKLATIFHQFEGKYPYSDIHIVRLFLFDHN